MGHTIHYLGVRGQIVVKQSSLTVCYVRFSQCIESIKKHNLLQHSLDFLAKEQNTKIIFNVLEGNYALCLLGKITGVDCQ